MARLRKYGASFHRAWPGGLGLSIALLALGACVHSTSARPSVNDAVSSKVSPLLQAAAQQLATGSSPSDFLGGRVRADSQGRLQVYVYISNLLPDNVATLVNYGLVDPLPSPALHLVQGWVNPQDLNRLASLPFVTRITPPHYGQPR